MFKRDQHRLAEVGSGLTGSIGSVAAHDLHARRGVSVDKPGVAGRIAMWIVDPGQLFLVRPAFRRDVGKRGRPIDDREVRKGEFRARELREGFREGLSCACDDKAVSRLDPCAAEV